MFKITKSLAIITLVIAAVAGTTFAFFKSDKRVAGASISIGSVNIGETQNLPFHLDNLAPGEVRDTGILGVKYTGTLPADLYFGVKATSGNDLKSILKMQLERYHWDGSGWVSDGYIFGDWVGVETAFAQWTQFANNVSGDQWTGAKLYIKVADGADNSFQGQAALNEVIIYSVQHGGPVPTTLPWEY